MRVEGTTLIITQITLRWAFRCWWLDFLRVPRRVNRFRSVWGRYHFLPSAIPCFRYSSWRLFLKFLWFNHRCERGCMLSGSTVRLDPCGAACLLLWPTASTGLGTASDCFLVFRPRVRTCGRCYRRRWWSSSSRGLRRRGGSSGWRWQGCGSGWWWFARMIPLLWLWPLLFPCCLSDRPISCKICCGIRIVVWVLLFFSWQWVLCRFWRVSCRTRWWVLRFWFRCHCCRPSCFRRRWWFIRWRGWVLRSWGFVWIVLLVGWFWFIRRLRWRSGRKGDGRCPRWLFLRLIFIFPFLRLRFGRGWGWVFWTIRWVFVRCSCIGRWCFRCRFCWL